MASRDGDAAAAALAAGDFGRARRLGSRALTPDPVVVVIALASLLTLVAVVLGARG